MLGLNSIAGDCAALGRVDRFSDDSPCTPVMDSAPVPRSDAGVGPSIGVPAEEAIFGPEAAVAAGLAPIEDYMAAGARRGLKWTEQRREVLHLLWSLGRPVGAYDAAARLSAGRAQVHPTTVYRCFHRLRNAGLVIKVFSWNRYLISPDPAASIWGLLLCKTCHDCRPIDLSHEQAGLERRAKAQGYAPSTYAVECQGRCLPCLTEEAQ